MYVQSFLFFLKRPFYLLSQLVFVYQRGMNTGGDVALDDITIFPGSCYPDPPIGPPDDDNGNLKPSSTASAELLSYLLSCNDCIKDAL